MKKILQTWFYTNATNMIMMYGCRVMAWDGLMEVQVERWEGQTEKVISRGGYPTYKTSNSEFLTEIFKKLSYATESDHSLTLDFWEIFLEYFNFWKKIKKLWKQSIYTTVNCCKFVSKITKLEKCVDCVSIKFSYFFNG